MHNFKLPRASNNLNVYFWCNWYMITEVRSFTIALHEASAQSQLEETQDRHKQGRLHSASRASAGLSKLHASPTFHTEHTCMQGHPLDPRRCPRPNAEYRHDRCRSRCQRKKVEMLFAHLESNLKLDRFRLPGANGAKNEFHLTTVAQNLCKMDKKSRSSAP